MVVPGDYMKVFKRKRNDPRRVGPFKVVLATLTAVKVKGKTTWFQLNHCSRAPALSRTSEDV